MYYIYIYMYYIYIYTYICIYLCVWGSTIVPQLIFDVLGYYSDDDKYLEDMVYCRNETSVV